MIGFPTKTRHRDRQTKGYYQHDQIYCLPALQYFIGFHGWGLTVKMFYWEQCRVKYFEGKQYNHFTSSLIFSLKCKLELELCDWASKLHINACFLGWTWVFLRCLLGHWIEELLPMTPVCSPIPINCKAD